MNQGFQSYRVNFTKSRRQVTVEEWFTLNLAARKAGLEIPTDCCHGVCGTCEVWTKQQGLVRACITLVSEDVEVQF
ncbi:2Fe-2S iron-sulfur cluster-binding protein [Anthocerotibacter panamensis]|uniref:2Fe-2S iron-sulfur cluster-binding protein n=1 Tax=Anthocerotibacter panamensis TaxID=2857077 RepID=UPI001C402884|nr:2Fe-2S iron-sulfur cluster binding domain-containing protein [Anthocerotibacter panamensis]